MKKATSYLDRDFFTEDRNHNQKRISADEYIRLSAFSEDTVKEYKNYLCRNAAQISITSRCNCKCLHCYAQDRFGNMNGEFTLEEIDRILDKCKDVGIKYIELTGGEPLIREDLNRIFGLINQKQLVLRAIHTNAILLNEQIIALLKENNMSPIFKVSFDGFGIHDRFRGCVGAQAAAIKGIEIINNSGFRLICNINVNRLTMPYVKDTARRLYNRFNADVFLIKTGPSPAWEKHINQSDIDFREYFDLCLDVIETSFKEGWKNDVQCLHMPTVSKNGNMDDVFKIWDARKNVVPSPYLMSNCGKACNMIYIAHDGRVLPCSGYEGYSKAEGLFAGKDVNILKTPLAEILGKSEYCDEFFVTLKTLVKQSVRCKNCQWLNICKGGCVLMSKYYISDRYGPPAAPNCVFFCEGYTEKLKSIVQKYKRGKPQ